MFSSEEISRASHSSWFERVSDDPAKTLMIFERDEKPMGFVNFDLIGKGAIADWGFYVSPDAPRGVGRALGALALAYAFDQAKFHKVCGRVIAFNRRSVAFHEKLGFHHEGVLRHHHFDGMHYHDVVCFGMLAKDRLHEN